MSSDAASGGLSTGPSTGPSDGPSAGPSTAATSPTKPSAASPSPSEGPSPAPSTSIYDHGFARVAAVTLPVALADPATNAQRHLEALADLDEQKVAVAVFPELSLTGYSLDDLVLQDPLLDAVEEAIDTLVRASEDLLPVIIVGAPLRVRSRVMNCAVVIHHGEVLGAAPKSNLPTYREFYERRWFAPGDDVNELITVAGRHEFSVTPHRIYPADDVRGLTIHVEICEDMWVPVPPSSMAALAGATVLVNLSGSPITIGRAEDRKLLARSASARCQAAYVYAAAGEGESTTDLAWDGQTFVYECGDLLGESERFPQGTSATIVDVDLDRIIAERRRQGTFDDNRRTLEENLPDYEHYDFFLFGTLVGFEDDDPRACGPEQKLVWHSVGGDPGDGRVSRPERPATGPVRRPLHRFPFVPDDPSRLAQDCYEAYSIQVAGLVQRLRAIGGDKPGGTKPVIGVSGGLDSTHALIVCARAMDLLGRDRSEILAYTMPGFATTERTRSNAELLAEALGASFETIDIRPACTQMLKDMGHPAGDGEPVYDVTFENVQAGMRYDYLFRLANHYGGIVVGTGDLSELALGWCTYGVGDQMSHYTVNSGVPKTLMQHLIRWVIREGIFDEHTGEVLQAVLDTEITPELIPHAEGQKAQSTEDSIGPYALHDFTLYHMLRRGYGPGKIAYLAHQAWGDIDAGEWPVGYPEEDRRAFTRGEIKHWLTVFIRRFFSNQFKRSAVPNGPKVLAGGSLSPRGDWRMPSDVSGRAWLAELERDVPGD
jgi:NAD+ synthase (glutamine-hydrolysing)